MYIVLERKDRFLPLWTYTDSNMLTGATGPFMLHWESSFRERKRQWRTQPQMGMYTAPSTKAQGPSQKSGQKNRKSQRSGRTGENHSILDMTGLLHSNLKSTQDETIKLAWRESIPEPLLSSRGKKRRWYPGRENLFLFKGVAFISRKWPLI